MPPDDALRRARPATRLRLLQALTIGLVVHGSLYPWHVAWPPSWAQAAAHFVGGPWWTGADDVLGNVVLFVPLGVLAAAWPAPAARRGVRLGLYAALAIALQLAQVFVPERDAVLSDAAWNGAGLLVGVALAQAVSHTRLPGTDRWTHGATVGWLLLWLALEAWPAPGTGWAWSTPSFVAAAAGMAMAAYLRSAPSGWPRFPLRALAVALAAARLLPGAPWASPGHAAGLLLGAALPWCRARRAARRLPRAAAALGIAWFAFDELRPFRWLPFAAATPFHAVPFAALLQGSMEANAAALLQQAFWLGGTVAALLEAGVPPWAGAAGLSGLVLALEYAQRWLPGRTADITPALLPLLALLAYAPATAFNVPSRADPPAGVRAARSTGAARQRAA